MLHFTMRILAEWLNHKYRALASWFIDNVKISMFMIWIRLRKMTSSSKVHCDNWEIVDFIQWIHEIRHFLDKLNWFFKCFKEKMLNWV